MAWIGKNISEYTGRPSWRIQLRKREYDRHLEVKKDNVFSASFSTEEEAKDFVEKWEPIFVLQGPGEIEYDRLMERRKRRIKNKIEDKT